MVHQQGLEEASPEGSPVSQQLEESQQSSCFSGACCFMATAWASGPAAHSLRTEPVHLCICPRVGHSQEAEVRPDGVIMLRGI